MISAALRGVKSAQRLWRRWLHRDRLDALRSDEMGEWVSECTAGAKRFSLRPTMVLPTGAFVQTKLGFFLFFDPRQTASALRGVEQTGEWEPEVMNCLRGILQDRDGAFIDVGANVGYFSFAVGIADSRRQVHAFEPDPANYSVLARNWDFNGRPDNITLRQLALGIGAESVSLCRMGMLSHVVKRGTDHSGPSVLMTSLDNYAATSQLERVAVVKIDVEGWEYDVIAGATGLLESSSPELLIEIDCRWLDRAGRTVTSLVALLDGLSYVPRQLDGVPSDDESRCSVCRTIHVPNGNYWFSRQNESAVR